MARTLGNVRLNEKNVASDRRPRQANDNTCPFHALLNFFLELKLGGAQQVRDHLRRDSEFRFLAFQNASRMFAADAGDLAFEIAHSRLPRVMPDDIVEGFILKPDLIRLQSAVLTTARHK